MSSAYPASALPWSISERDEARFRRILGITLTVVSAWTVAVPLLPLPQATPVEAPVMPPRYAQLMFKPVTPQAEPPAPEATPSPKAQTLVARTAPTPPRTALPAIVTARAQAERSGLLAARDDLAELRRPSVTTSQKYDVPLAPAVSERTDNIGTSSIIASTAAAPSAGIDGARLPRATGGSGLTARATTRMDGPFSGSGARAQSGGGSGSGSGSGSATRAVEDIERVLDQNKGSVYALYDRVLRTNPTVRGRVVLQFTIAASGAVTSCVILSSDLKTSELERKLVARVRQFNFGAAPVGTIIVTYPIEFAPS